LLLLAIFALCFATKNLTTQMQQFNYIFTYNEPRKHSSRKNWILNWKHHHRFNYQRGKFSRTKLPSSKCSSCNCLHRAYSYWNSWSICSYSSC